MDPSVKSRPYDMSSRARQAQETRRRIVEAAARLFTRNGYSATSVSAIAEDRAPAFSRYETYVRIAVNDPAVPDRRRSSVHHCAGCVD
jgi:hypothetical protein